MRKSDVSAVYEGIRIPSPSPVMAAQPVRAIDEEDLQASLSDQYATYFRLMHGREPSVSESVGLEVAAWRDMVHLVDRHA